MKTAAAAAVLSVLPATVTAFSLLPTAVDRTSSRIPLRSTPSDEGDDGLVLGGLDEEMGKVKSQYSFTENDFLAAAKRRSQERKASVESGAKDEDWKELAEEKKQLYGEMDDWENSKKEAGNIDSQILMFTEKSEDDDDDDEPKLLLS